MNPIRIEIDYAADDSCQIRLWSRGHHGTVEFLIACEKALVDWDERRVDMTGKSVRTEHWRTVPADRQTLAIGACDRLHVKSLPGQGAYPVTVLDEWQPLHNRAADPVTSTAPAMYAIEE